jgi:hypothetical protein
VILRLATKATRRVLEELTLFHLAQRIPQPQGHPDLWKKA